MKLKAEMKELVESRIHQAADKKLRESRFKDQEEAEFQAAAKYMADMVTHSLTHSLTHLLTHSST